MDKDTIRQVFMLVASSVVYLMSIGTLKNLFDGLVVMIFFFAVFPFLSITIVLVIKFLKGLLSIKSY
jgi:hypothetical protein